MYSFTIKIDPVPASRPRVARYGTYYLPKYTQYRKDLAKQLSCLKKVEGIYNQLLMFNIRFVMPLPKSATKKTKAELVGQFCGANIDLDNLEKALYDAMNGVIFADDKQVVQHTVEKIWGLEGKIIVSFCLANDDLWRQKI